MITILIVLGILSAAVVIVAIRESNKKVKIDKIDENMDAPKFDNSSNISSPASGSIEYSS